MSDWTGQAADRIEQIVATVRDRTVVPARSASQVVIYGLLAVFFVGTAAVLLTILLFRLLCLALPIWAAWLVLGGIFVAAGAFCWAIRSRSLEALPDA
jgi:hypothetical protein